MLDNQLIALIIGIIRTGLTARSLTANVRQYNQPRQQGTPTENTVLLMKMNNRRYGYLGRTDEYDEDASEMVHTETQWLETPFQVGALAIQDPANVNSLTASDLVNIVASILQSDATLAQLQSQGVGMLRIIDIRNPYFSDDKERFEASPSFDFSVTHEQVDISQVPVLQSTELNIIEV